MLASVCTILMEQGNVAGIFFLLWRMRCGMRMVHEKLMQRFERNGSQQVNQQRSKNKGIFPFVDQKRHGFTFLHESDCKLTKEWLFAQWNTLGGNIGL